MPCPRQRIASQRSPASPRSDDSSTPRVPGAAHLRKRNVKPYSQEFDVAPLGDEMPMGLWGVPISEIPHAKSGGFNLIHNYEGPPTSTSYMNAAREAGLAVMGQIGGGTLGDPHIATPEEIQTLAAFDNLAWWYLQPEEIRWNASEEMNVLVATSDLVAAHDPQQRPIYNYQPANRLDFEVGKFSPYAGVYGMGLYTNNYLMPRPWVRWVMENTLNGIAMSKEESLPIAVPGMFNPE